MSTAASADVGLEALRFDSQGEQLVGVLHRPGCASSIADLGVVVLVGGPQYRVGSHRQFVLLARALADAGFPALRFDLGGMGDSTGPLRTFEQSAADVGAAIDTLMSRRPELRGVVLWGLCDGASAALLYLAARADGRVRGLCLVNPWVRTEATHARTIVRHYYWRRITQPEFWGKLLRGQVGLRAVGELSASLSTSRARAQANDDAPYVQRMLRAWRGFGGRTLVVLSGNDYTAREFADLTRDDPHWVKALRRPEVARVDIGEADHTFSDGASRQALEASTLQWLRTLAAGDRA
jgi:exosortase A-associated hydrolase 1